MTSKENLNFLKNENIEFSKIVRKRVHAYFKERNLSKTGNHQMVLKTTCMLLLFLVPLTILGTGIVHSPYLLFGLYLISGLGMAGIGLGVMHDAIHGAYSHNRTVNKYMGYTMNLIGANATVWRIQHNVLHHTYTNIEAADDDINTPFFLRFSPHTKRYWIHRFQYVYIWLFYGLSTLSWVTTKDFIRIRRYKHMGFLHKKGAYRKELLKLISWKLFYYCYVLVIPLLMVSLPYWMVLLAFLSMHFVTGLSISLIFQTAHIMPDTQFPQPDKNGVIMQDWAIHQLATTSNYAPKSRIFSWCIGGLNYQIEHHLFPNICHIHYRKISGIVSDTAREYNIPYLVKKTFISALWEHTKMLRQLGRL